MKLQAFVCKLFSRILDSPIELQLFCSQCCIDHLLSLPVQITTLQHIRMPSQITLMSLASLTVQCSQGECSKRVALGKLQEHRKRLSCQGVDSQKEKFLHTPALAECTLAEVLTAPIHKTPNTTEKKVATHLIRRLMKSTSEIASDDFLSLKTGRQVCMHFTHDLFHAIIDHSIHL